MRTIFKGFAVGRRSLAAALLGAALLAAPPPALAVEKIMIGTGSRAGIYYLFGRSVCHLLAPGTAEHGFACRSVATPGSISNLKGLQEGDYHLGIVQSDWQHHAYNGTAAFAGAGPAENLRALFSIHSEPFTALARRDSGIARLEDLEGKRVNLGNPGSGQRATMELVMQAMGWTRDDFQLVLNLGLVEQMMALCHNRVQATAYIIGHPNALTRKAMNQCDVRLVPVEAEAIDKLVADTPYYVPTTIPGGFYPSNPDPVATFGTLATAVVTADADPAMIRTILDAVFSNLDTLRSRHPAWRDLTPEAMASEGLAAPLHEEAARYYREKGILAAEPET